MKSLSLSLGLPQDVLYTMVDGTSSSCLRPQTLYYMMMWGRVSLGRVLGVTQLVKTNTGVSKTVALLKRRLEQLTL